MHADITASRSGTLGDTPDTIADEGAGRRSGPAAGKILLYLPCFAGGGAERVFMRLAGHLVERGYLAEMVVNTEKGPLRDLLPETVPLHVLGSSRSLRSLWPFVRLLRRERPAGVISALTGTNINAVMAVKLSRIDTRLMLCERNQFSTYLERLTPARRLMKRVAVRTLYPRAHVITGNTSALARDISVAAGLHEDAAKVIPNPAPDASTIAAARLTACPHPWFEEEIPVAVAIARLEPSKDYPTMLRAMARLKGRLRLVILGEGAERAKIERLIEELELEGTVTLAGFRMNRFDYLVRARLFILSSSGEGFPNSLIEAAGAGIPCVSTDCAGGGAREILGADFPEAIVPVGDDAALAAAIEEELGRKPQRARLEAIAARYSLDTTTQRVLDAIGL